MEFCDKHIHNAFTQLNHSLYDAETVPSEVVNFTVSQTLEGQVQLEWEAPEINGSSPITGYNLTYGVDRTGNCPDTPGPQTTVTALSTGRQVTLTNTLPWTRYRFTIQAVNEVGPSVQTEKYFLTKETGIMMYSLDVNGLKIFRHVVMFWCLSIVFQKWNKFEFLYPIWGRKS